MSPSDIDGQTIDESKLNLEIIEDKKEISKKLRISETIKEKGMSRFFLAILANIIVGPIALALYFPLDGNYRILKDEYFFHAVITFVCFAILPVIYLGIEQLITKRTNYFYISTLKGFNPKKVVNSFLQGILMHAGIFYPWVVLSQRYMPGVAKLNYFFIKPGDWAWYILFVSLNVIMMEYYTKAFIQIQFEEAISAIKMPFGYQPRKVGKLVGFVVQFIVWMGGHWLELTWLPNYLGLVNAIFFIMVSGLLTGYTVYKTGNIFGVTIGHILLNVFITATYNV
ncbi:MAG: hypothetical protein FK730_07605 [Asgard group archaeon]|nr:hypothetical protein [Asgard group archaeon]